MTTDLSAPDETVDASDAPEPDGICVERDPAGCWTKPHRAVVFVHGMGSQERGDTLMDFVDPLVTWLRARKKPDQAAQWDCSESLNAPDLTSYPRQGGKRAYTRMEFGDTHRFELTEALWTETFKPLPNDNAIRWSRRFLTHMGLENVKHHLWRAFQPTSVGGAGLLWPFGWLHELFERLHSLLLCLVFPIAVIVGYLVLGLLWITDGLPLPGIIPNSVAKLLNQILGFISGSLGDIAVYLENPGKRDAIRQVLEDILEEYDNNPNCSSVLVLAHSLGSVVAYDALSRRRQRIDEQEQASESFKVQTLITVGGIISPVWKLYKDNPIFSKGRPQCLDEEGNPIPTEDCPDGTARTGVQAPAKGVRWIYQWAPYDPGPAGAMADSFRTTAATHGAEVIPEPVDNRATMAEDHVTYSVNDEQVIGTLAEELFRLPDGSDAPHESRPYYRNDDQRKDDHALRKKQVAILSLVRSVVYTAIIGVFAYFAVASVSSGEPAAKWLNRIDDSPVLQRTISFLYKVPNNDHDAIEFIAEENSLKVRVIDNAERPKLVRDEDERQDVEQVDDGIAYTTDESNVRVALWNFWLLRWDQVFISIIIPGFLTLFVAIVLLLFFRIYRDILWKRSFTNAQAKRHQQYIC